MAVPDKIYIEQTPNGGYYWDVIKDVKSNESDIEYTRTDAFVEKACEWLKNSTYGYLTEKWGETEIDRETLTSDFAKYMKGE